MRRRLCYLDDSCGTQFCRSGRQYKCYLSFHLQIQMQIQIQYLEDCCGTQFFITNAFISAFHNFHRFFSRLWMNIRYSVGLRTYLKPKNVFPIVYMNKNINFTVTKYFCNSSPNQYQSKMFLVVTQFVLSSLMSCLWGRALRQHRQGKWSLDNGSSHWQESRSREISRRNDSLFSLSLEKIKFSFPFLFSIFKIFRK